MAAGETGAGEEPARLPEELAQVFDLGEVASGVSRVGDVGRAEQRGATPRDREQSVASLSPRQEESRIQGESREHEVGASAGAQNRLWLAGEPAYVVGPGAGGIHDAARAGEGLLVVLVAKRRAIARST